MTSLHILNVESLKGGILLSNPWFSSNGYNKGFNKGYNKSDNKSHSDSDSKSKSDLDFDNEFDNEVDSASKSRNKNSAVAKVFKSGNSEVYVDAKVYSDTSAKVRAKAESDQDQDQDQKQHMKNKQHDYFFGKQSQEDGGHDSGSGKNHKY